MIRVSAAAGSLAPFLAVVMSGVTLLGGAPGVASADPDPSPAQHIKAFLPDPELTGEWVGHADTAPISLEIRIRLERVDEGWGAQVAIPREGLDAAPAERVEVDEGSVEILLPGGQAELHVRRDGERLEGSLEGMAGTLGVTLVRPDSPEADAMSRELERARHEVRADPLRLACEGPAHDRVDGDALARLVEEAKAAHSTSLVVLHDGELVGEWHSGGEPRLVEAMSVTKVALNLAAGRLRTLGALESLDTPVHEFYPEWSRGERSGVTVRHLLNHTSGLESPAPTQPIYESGDFVRFALESSLAEEPGSEIRYNNNATNLLAGVLGKAAGEPLDTFLRDDLFRRLGITEFDWSRDPAGNPHGMAGLQIHPGDLARLGQLALQEGAWQDEELIESEWFRESLRPGSPHHRHVGLLWQLLRDDHQTGDEPPAGFMHDGYLGQYLVVYPEERLVGVRMVEQSPGYDPATDGFERFPERLRELVK